MAHTSRQNYDRMAGERLLFQATIRRHRWGWLFDEMKARGWTPVKVNKRTGGRDKNGVWVFRYEGFDTDEAVTGVRRQMAAVTIKSRRPG